MNVRFVSYVQKQLKQLHAKFIILARFLFTADNHRQWTAFTSINKSHPNQVPSSPHPSSMASTQSITNSVQGISLSAPSLSTQAALDSAIASIINSPPTSSVQVISSGVSMPHSISMSMSQAGMGHNSMSNALVKSVTIVKRAGDTSSGK